MTKGLKKIDLAHALGVDASLVSRYTERGMPTSSVAAALEWKAQNIRPRVKVSTVEQTGLFDYDQARSKREHFAAMMAETQARKEMGELIEIAEIERMAAQMGTTLRLALEGFPAMLAPQLVGLSESEIFSVMTVNIERLLHGLSRDLHALERGGE